MKLALPILLCCASLGAAIIPADRRPLWTGNVGVRGGIPDSSAMTVYTNLGTSATYLTISNAIANCPSNQVVQLTNGTYNLTGSIIMQKDGVVLRGVGTNTILDFNGGGDIGIAAGENNGTYQHIPLNIVASQPGEPDPADTPTVSVNWTAGYSTGTSNITVASAAGLSVGNFVGLDQLNDNLLASSAGGEGPCDTCGRLRGTRSQFQWAVITAINGTTITIDPPLFMGNYASGLDPELWFADATWLRRSGVENLTIDGLHSGGLNPYSAMYLLFLGYECWVKNVRFYCLGAGHTHLETYGSMRCEFRGCELIGEAGGSLSYGMAPIFSTGDVFENNWMDGMTGPAAPGWSVQGLVLSYNYVRNNYQAYDSVVNSNWNAAAFTMHNAHGCGWLVEGNYMNTFLGDFIHGSGSHNTIFRNRLEGKNPGTYQISSCFTLQSTQHCYNVVGNVLGKVMNPWNTNWHTSLLAVGDPAPEPDRSIYLLGWMNGQSDFDPEVTNTIYIHANYDIVTSTNNGIVWTTNSDKTLPDSLLYASKPSWFVGAWPPFSPSDGSNIVRNDLAFTNIPAGYRYYFGSNPPPDGGSSAMGRLRVIGSARATRIIGL